MKSYLIKVEYLNPRKWGQESTKTVGPVYSKKAVNELLVVLLKKRNVVSAEVKESYEISN